MFVLLTAFEADGSLSEDHSALIMGVLASVRSALAYITFIDGGEPEKVIVKQH